MQNPLLNLPFNTKRVYVCGVSLSGCDIYIPVDSFDEQEQKAKKYEFQTWIDKTYEFVRAKKPC